MQRQGRGVREKEGCLRPEPKDRAEQSIEAGKEKGHHDADTTEPDDPVGCQPANLSDQSRG